jgi:hypothetical protein
VGAFEELQFEAEGAAVRQPTGIRLDRRGYIEARFGQRKKEAS